MDGIKSKTGFRVVQPETQTQSQNKCYFYKLGLSLTDTHRDIHTQQPNACFSSTATTPQAYPESSEVSLTGLRSRTLHIWLAVHPATSPVTLSLVNTSNSPDVHSLLSPGGPRGAGRGHPSVDGSIRYERGSRRHHHSENSHRLHRDWRKRVRRLNNLQGDD